MRIAVSGTHCSGKSTLVDEFLAAHRDYAHEPEPYEWLEALDDGLADVPDADAFQRQLEISVERLRSYAPGTRVIAERSPLDFIAYLLALEELGREGSDSIDSAMELARGGMEHVDLLVVLPLNDRDGIAAPQSEDLELREAMNDRLLELIASADFDRVRTIEVSGGRAKRLAMLERALDARAT